MTELVLVVLAVLAMWEVARRLLPVKLPQTLAITAWFGMALVLLTWAPPHTLLAIAAAGGVVLLANTIAFANVYHWGPLATALLARLTGRRKTIGKDTDTRPKRRIPKLPT